MVAYSVAIFSMIAFIALWFWMVKKELKAKRNMVGSAKAQLDASRTQRMKTTDTLEAQKAQEILVRSINIYQQSLELYKKALHKPWNYLPGLIMGFRFVGKEDIH